MTINPFIALINLIMVGGVDSATAALFSTAAQTRVLQKIILQPALSFAVPRAPAKKIQLSHIFAADPRTYDAWVHKRTPPLRERAGTPARAATVCLATALQRWRTFFGSRQRFAGLTSGWKIFILATFSATVNATCALACSSEENHQTSRQA